MVTKICVGNYVGDIYHRAKFYPNRFWGFGFAHAWFRAPRHKVTQLLFWFLRKYDDDWVKKCMEYEVKGSEPRGRPKRTWKEVVREDCQARKLNKEDTVDRYKWRKVIREVRWPGWVWAASARTFGYLNTRVPDGYWNGYHVGSTRVVYFLGQ